MSSQRPSLSLHSLPAQPGGSAILPLSDVCKLSLTISSLFNPCVSGSAIGPFTQPLILVCVWGGEGVGYLIYHRQIIAPEPLCSQV